MKNKNFIIVFFILIIIIGSLIISFNILQSQKRVIFPNFPDVIAFEDIVYVANKSLISESEVRNFIFTNILQFWDNSIDQARYHGLYYPENYTPLLKYIDINLIDLTTENSSHRWGPKQWLIIVPAITQNAEWRIDYNGIIQEKLPSAYKWQGARYMWFLIEQQNGTVRVIG